MEDLIGQTKAYVERQAFGVCTWMGQKLGVSTSNIRLYFIYISFLTIGSPIVLYLILAFWLNFKRYLRRKMSPFWDQ
jgi:phage shock protein PspC (stress-responsive transcriptional regulator)